MYEGLLNITSINLTGSPSVSTVIDQPPTLAHDSTTSSNINIFISPFVLSVTIAVGLLIATLVFVLLFCRHKCFVVRKEKLVGVNDECTVGDRSQNDFENWLTVTSDELGASLNSSRIYPVKDMRRKGSNPMIFLYSETTNSIIEIDNGTIKVEEGDLENGS